MAASARTHMLASLLLVARAQGTVQGARPAMRSAASLLRARAFASDAAPAKPPPAKKRVLSGVQPTGTLHLGNYLGAMRQWVNLQDEYDNYFCVVDLHAITMPHSPKELTESTYRTAALYLACGIDPKRSRVFVQSHVRAHAELCWLLNCITPMNWLERMIQFKEKAVKQGESVAVGLFDYPVLMAADIILYQAELVPVGEDQRQHLELARDIVRRFHDTFCDKKSKRRPVFREPEALILKEAARIMSLQDGTAKMSKSAESELSRIQLLDSPAEIARKIKKCKTDSFPGLAYADPARPEATNLINMYQAVTGQTQAAVMAEVEGMSWGDFKPRLSDALIAHLEPIQARYNALALEPEYLKEVLTDGADAASAVADQTLLWAKEAMGITQPGGVPILSAMPAPPKSRAAA